MTTIYALSSGRPPAAIAVMRISGPDAFDTVRDMAGSLPPARRASLRDLRAQDGGLIDRSLVLIFPGPNTATGEDLAELHLHGGRAVVAKVENELSCRPGLRAAEAGEFTRRALSNGRIDLAQAHGLADLLEAETELQRRAALAASEGELSRKIADWRRRIIDMAAMLEAQLDFDDEHDVAVNRVVAPSVDALLRDMEEVLARPSAEQLREGFRVVIAGPPNAGKSSLLNALVGRAAAIVTPIAGTTRDAIEVSVARRGIPYTMIDTAGLRKTDDVVERIGVDRASSLMRSADLVLWLGDHGDGASNWLPVHSRCDLPDRQVAADGAIPVSVHDDATIDALWELLHQTAKPALSIGDAAALRASQQDALEKAIEHLRSARDLSDMVLIAEEYRQALRSLTNVTGGEITESILDALFARFCVGK